MEQREALRLALVERAKEARKKFLLPLFGVRGGGGPAVRRRLGVRRVQH